VAVFGVCQILIVYCLFLLAFPDRTFEVEYLVYCLIGFVPYALDSVILHRLARDGSFSRLQAILTGGIVILGLCSVIAAVDEAIPIIQGNPPPKMSGAAFIVTTVWLYQVPIAVVAFFASGFSR